MQAVAAVTTATLTSPPLPFHPRRFSHARWEAGARTQARTHERALARSRAASAA